MTSQLQLKVEAKAGGGQPVPGLWERSHSEVGGDANVSDASGRDSGAERNPDLAAASAAAVASAAAATTTRLRCRSHRWKMRTSSPSFSSGKTRSRASLIHTSVRPSILQLAEPRLSCRGGCRRSSPGPHVYEECAQKKRREKSHYVNPGPVVFMQLRL